MSSNLVLVVEDNKMERYTLKHLLERMDYSVHTVDSGEEAINALRHKGYAAVLMDITLPGMSGTDCTRVIRHMEEGMSQRTPIIGLSARTMAAEQKAAIEAGMNAYLTKPVSREALHLTLSQFAQEANEITRGTAKVISINNIKIND